MFIHPIGSRGARRPPRRFVFFPFFIALITFAAAYGQSACSSTDSESQELADGSHVKVDSSQEQGHRQGGADGTSSSDDGGHPGDAYDLGDTGDFGDVAIVDGTSEADSKTEPISTPTSIRIANYNVENLFNDKIDSPGISNEKGITPNTAAYQKRLKNLATAIASLNADVLVLEEVENKNALSDLAAQTQLSGKYTQKILGETNDPRGIHVALLATSTFLVTSVASHKKDVLRGGTDASYTFSRDCLEVHLDVRGQDLTLLGVHLRSQLNSASLDEDDKRFAEAKRVREIADEQLAKNQNAKVIILGDFNDTPGSLPIEAIRGAKPPFVNASSALLESERWSLKYSGKSLLYDDQWLSPSAEKGLQKETVTMGPYTASDHRPIAASYLF